MKSQMKKMMILIFVASISVTMIVPAFAQAEVEDSSSRVLYFMDNFEGNLRVRSAGASDLDALAFLLNIGWGCEPLSFEDRTELRIHNVLTPSGNDNQSLSGPMWHVVWPVGPGPCNPANWIAFGYGQYSSINHSSERKNSFSSHFTGSGYLQDLYDLCEGDYIGFSAIWHVAGENVADCDLSTPGAGIVSGCDKVDEKVNLECPDLLP